MHVKIASIMLLASILGLGAIAPVGIATAQSESLSSISGGFASITTEQSGDKIVITIVKEPGGTPQEGNVTLPEVPVDPIIIIPSPGGEGNGTVVIPGPPAEGNETTTVPGNETTTEPPVVIVTPPVGNESGEIIQVEPPSNVTQIDNDTVVVAPPNQNVTETPGNVTVIDPAPTPEPEPCGCPPSGVEGAPPDIATTPTGNETTTGEAPPIAAGTEPGGSDGGSSGSTEGESNSNGNGDGSNGGG